MHFIDQITNYIIRPTRQRYHISRLGPKQIFLNTPQNKNISSTTRFTHNRIASQLQNNNLNADFLSIFRDDYKIPNPTKNLQLCYSYYTNHMATNPDLVVIYLHANNGSRVEGLHYVNFLLENKYNVCLLDFAGSGSSQGQYVTLGCEESEDLRTVVKHMELVKGVRRIVLWGRSMGACTAIMYASKIIKQDKQNNCKLIGMILDSPFQDLRKLVKQTASDKTGLPQILFQPILSFVNDQLKQKIGHVFQQYDLTSYLKQMSSIQTNFVISALFITSSVDKLVKSHHVQQLFQQYPGIKNLDKFLYHSANQHHEDRDMETINNCIEFINYIIKKSAKLVKTFQIPENNYFYHPNFSTQKNLQSPKFSFKTRQLVNLQNSMVFEPNTYNSCQLTYKNTSKYNQSNNNVRYEFSNRKSAQQQASRYFRSGQKSIESTEKDLKEMYIIQSPGQTKKKQFQDNRQVSFNYSQHFNSQINYNLQQKKQIKPQRQRIKLSKNIAYGISSTHTKINMNNSYQQSLKLKPNANYYNIQNQNAQVKPGNMINSFSHRSPIRYTFESNNKINKIIQNQGDKNIYNSIRLGKGQSGIKIDMNQYKTKNMINNQNYNLGNNYNNQLSSHQKTWQDNKNHINNSNCTTKYTNNNYNIKMDQNLHIGQQNKLQNVTHLDNYNYKVYANENIKTNYQNIKNIQFDQRIGFQKITYEKSPSTNKLPQNTPIYLSYNSSNHVYTNHSNSNYSPNLQANNQYIPNNTPVQFKNFHANYPKTDYPAPAIINNTHNQPNKPINFQHNVVWAVNKTIRPSENTRSYNRLPPPINAVENYRYGQGINGVKHNNSLNYIDKRSNLNIYSNKINLSKINKNNYY